MPTDVFLSQPVADGVIWAIRNPLIRGSLKGKKLPYRRAEGSLQSPLEASGAILGHIPE